MSLRYQDFVLRDFSGGISDNYLNTPLNRYEVGDNIFILQDRSFETRYGSIPVYDREIDQKIDYITDLNDEIICVRESLLWTFDEQAGTLVQPQRPQSGAPVFPEVDGFYAISSDEWQDQLIFTHSGSQDGNRLNRPMRIYRDNNDVLKLSQLGLSGLTAAQVSNIEIAATSGGFYYDRLTPNPPPSPSSFANTYIYAFIYSYEYQTGRSKYRVVSDVRISSILYTNSAINSSGGTSITFNPLSSLAYDSTGNQNDTANIKLEIYRTVTGGQDFFKVHEQDANLALSFTDSQRDLDIVTGEPLYISGGILDRFQAPKARYVKIINDTPYWGYVADEDSEDVKPFRIIQGFSGVVDSHDPAAYVDLDDEIRGIGEARGFPIVFTASEIYRLEGTFDNTGGGSVRPRTISETAGCASHNSIVSANDNLYWIGDNAVYVTNGYTVDKVPSSIDLLDTIRELVRSRDTARTIKGEYDENNERIIWAVNKNGIDNAEWLVLNLNTLGFTTCSGLPSSSIHFVGDSLYRSDELGYIYKHEDGITSDPVRKPFSPISDWEETHIDWLYKSVGMDFGDPSLTNWVSHFSPYIQSDTNYGVLVSVDCDDGRVQRSCKFIRSWGNLFWGDPDLVWGDPEIIWSKPESIRHKRHTPRGTSRAKTRQVIMKPADVVIYKSDTYGECNISYVNPSNPVEVNVSLVNGDWPEGIFGYRIAFETDNYEAEYNILNFDSTNIVLQGSIVPASGVKWQIVGKYKKSQLSVKALTIRVAPIDNEGNEFTSGGGNE